MKKYAFKPDPSGRSWIDKLYITPQQRSAILKWVLYGVVCLFALVIQDVLFSTVRPFGGTVDLLVAAVFCICLVENAERGGKFAVAAGLFYLFSGSAPGHYVILLLTAFGILAAILRRSYLQEGFFADYLCVLVAIFFYEMCVFGIALFQRHTILSAFPRFSMTAVNTGVAGLLLYPLLRAIGQMGGNEWKE